MKTPFLKTYIALVVLAALGAYALLVESKRTPSKPGEKAHEKIIKNFERSRVKELTLTPARGEAVRIARQGDGWELMEPQKAPAASNEIDTLLSGLETLEIEAMVADNVTNLEEYGLKAPSLSVGVFVEKDSQPITLLLGDDVPAHPQVFAKLASDARVFSISNRFKTTFDKKPFDLRDRDLLHLKRDAVASLAVEGPEGAYALKRRGAEEWTFTAPLKTCAGRWSVDSLIGTLEYLRLDAIAEETAKSLEPFGLDRPARRVIIGLGDKEQKTLEIGGKTKDDKFYAREGSSRLVGVVPRTIIDDLAKGMNELRAKRLLDVSAYDIESFDVEHEGKKQLFARTSSKDKDGIDKHQWKRTAPQTQDLETKDVQDVLFKIGGIDVKEFVDKPGASSIYGLDKPVIKVTLRHVPPRPTAWFELGRAGDDVFARRPDDDAILKLDASKAQELIDGFLGLCASKPKS